MTKNLISFLIAPFSQKENRSITRSLLLLLQVLILYLAVMALWGAIRYCLIKTELTDGGLSISKQIFNNSLKFFERKGPIMAFAYVALMVPIWEELTFRFFLSFKKWHIITSILSFIIFLGILFALKLSYYGIATAVLLLTIALSRKHLTEQTLNKFKGSYGICLFHLMPFIFAICHFKQLLPLQYNLIPGYIIYIIPLILFGYFSSFLRLRAGFMYSVLFHMILNGLMSLRFII